MVQNVLDPGQPRLRLRDEQLHHTRPQLIILVVDQNSLVLCGMRDAQPAAVARAKRFFMRRNAPHLASVLGILLPSADVRADHAAHSFHHLSSVRRSCVPPARTGNCLGGVARLPVHRKAVRSRCHLCGGAPDHYLMVLRTFVESKLRSHHSPRALDKTLHVTFLVDCLNVDPAVCTISRGHK